MQKRGLSTIISAVLIILITIVAIAVIWIFILPLLGINIGSNGGDVSIVTSRGYTVYDSETEMASVQIKRGDDDSQLNSIDVIFSIEGESIKFTIPKKDILDPNSIKLYKFDLSEGAPDSVIIVPSFGVGRGSVTGKVISIGRVIGIGNVIGGAELKIGKVVQDGTFYELDAAGNTVSFSFDEDGNIIAIVIGDCFNSDISPIPICTCPDLQEMNGYLSYSFELQNDIDCSDSGFESIGYSDGNNNDHDDAFTGTFDGGGYTISNLYISSSDSGVGLFAYTSGATISRVGLENVYANGETAVGALVGYAFDNTQISEVFSTGSISSNQYYAGGLVGVLSGSDITDSYSRADVNGYSDEVGGLVGYMEQTTYANLRNTYATGSASGNNKVGGLVGETYSDGLIENSFAVGSVYGYNGNSVGGLIGLYSGDTTVSNSYWNSYSSDSCTGDNFASDCYSVSDINELYGSSHPVYYNWDFDNIWSEETGNYPKLAWEKETSTGGSIIRSEGFILWTNERNGEWDVVLYNMSTGVETIITSASALQTWIGATGENVVWQEMNGGNYDIYMYDITTGIETQITTSSGNQELPTISGNKIVWTDDRNGNDDIYIYDINTGVETQITTDTGDQWGAIIWTP